MAAPPSRLGRAAYVVATGAVLLLGLLSASIRSLPMGYRGETAWQGLQFRRLEAGRYDHGRLYQQAGPRMNAWCADGRRPSVGCIEIGILGYYFQGRILDVFGLVSPEVLDVLRPDVLARLDPSCHEFPLNVLMTFRPDYIVAVPLYLKRTPPPFLEIYRPIPWPDLPLRVFVRRDLMDPMAQAAGARGVGAGNLAPSPPRDLGTIRCP
jgi:hypothetical protein